MQCAADGDDPGRARQLLQQQASPSVGLGWVRVTQVISVPPDSSWTQDVSGRRASAVATGIGGVRRAPHPHEPVDVAEAAAASGTPTTRSAPAARSRR